MDEIYLASVDSSGNVQWNYPQIVTSLCAVQVSHFPWDLQICELEFGSWSYSGAEVSFSQSNHHCL